MMGAANPGPPPGIGFTEWLGRLRSLFGPVSGRSGNGTAFTASTDRLFDGKVNLSRLRIDAQSIELPVKGATGPWRDSIQVIFPLAGQFHLEQEGRILALSPGDWGLYDPSLGFRSTTEKPVDILMLTAPRTMVLSHGLGPEWRKAQRFSAEAGSGRVARDYLVSLSEARAGLSPSAGDELIAVAVQLVRLSMLEKVAQRSRAGHRALLRVRMQAYIMRNLRNPDLSVDSIAAVHNCSKRYVHKVFAEDGRTLGDYIREVRLERCMRDLTSRELAHLSVTDIAFSWGFQHQSHFSRLFRKRFNVPPSFCRRHPDAIAQAGSAT